MKGRKPKPSALRVIEGMRGHRPLPTGEPKPEGTMPPCPKWLSKGARVHWRQLAPQLLRMGVLTRIDGTSLACFCDCLERYTEAIEFLEKNGSVIVVRDDKGQFRFTQPAPQVGIAAKMLEQMNKIGSEFGWAPAARARLSVPGAKLRPLDEIAAERAAQRRKEWDREEKKGQR
jgi:P27 family predicted phage terminase small subunit